ncbi:MAG TPA: hypothetical protein VL380_02115 [Nitrosospira sp.]|nr:hypothetical protein [Nitrosospira sp.]
MYRMLQLTEEVSAVTYKNRFWLSSVFNQGKNQGNSRRKPYVCQRTEPQLWLKHNYRRNEPEPCNKRLPTERAYQMPTILVVNEPIPDQH